MMNPSVCLMPLIATPGPAHGVKSLIPPSVISTDAGRLGPLIVIFTMVPFAQRDAGTAIIETASATAPIAFMTPPNCLDYLTTLVEKYRVFRTTVELPYFRYSNIMHPPIEPT